MSEDSRNTWTLKSRRRAYQNPWISVDHDEVVTPGGSDGIYGVVRFENVAIGIVTLDELGRTTLVGQWRYPLERYSWEIPEGGGPKRDPTLASAKRELREETGLIAARWTELVELDLSNSVTDEVGILYLAEGLSQGPAAPEDTEDLALRIVTLERALDMVSSGEIRDALTIVGLLATDRVLRSRRVCIDDSAAEGRTSPTD